MGKTVRKVRRTSSIPRKGALDGWDQSWRRYWSTAGLPAYELPAGGPDSEERDFLGQTRTPESEHARIGRIMDEFERGFTELYTLGPAVTVFGSARFKEKHPYYQLARSVGAELARAGFTTLTGGGPGIMEAANRGAHEAGGRSIGLNIVLPHEQGANPYVDKSVTFNYFFVRKVMLVKYSCAFIVMPGGLGTLDEMFEAATLIQCHKIGPFPVVLVGKKFWRGMQIWGQSMMKQGVYGKEELGFGRVTDSAKDAVDLVLRGLPPDLRKMLNPQKEH
jgi:uncharacterized protein (TIGR00730 family)